MTTARLFIAAGAAAAALAVAIGAFAAHALKGRLSADMTAVFQTGVQYHFLHALGLVAVGLLALHVTDSALLRWSGGLMLAGMVLFSGSLYLIALTGMRSFGAVAPIGGSAFIAAWVLLALAVVRAPGA